MKAMLFAALITLFAGAALAQTPPPPAAPAQVTPSQPGKSEADGAPKKAAKPNKDAKANKDGKKKGKKANKKKSAKPTRDEGKS